MRTVGSCHAPASDYCQDTTTHRAVGLGLFSATTFIEIRISDCGIFIPLFPSLLVRVAGLVPFFR